MAPKLEAYLSGVSGTAPPGVKLTDVNLIPQGIPDFSGVESHSPPGVKITPSLFLPQTDLLRTPFSSASPAVLRLIDGTPPERPTADPDPSSEPYVEVGLLIPAPGSANIAASSSLFIPCGDRIPEDDEIGIDLFGGGGTPIPYKGLNDLKNVIRIRYNSGPWIKIYENGSGINGWSATKTVNDYAGYEKDQYVGYDYTLTPPGAMTAGAVVDVMVELEDYGEKYSFYTYSFTTALQSAITVDRIFVVQELLLRVDFNGELAITDALINPDNYSIVPTRPVGDVRITGVLPPDGTVTNKILLQVVGLKLDQIYSLSIPGGVLQDREGKPLKPIQFTWRMRRTKMDVTVSGLPGLYDTRERTTIGGILEAIMISDEEIGGDY